MKKVKTHIIFLALVVLLSGCSSTANRVSMQGNTFISNSYPRVAVQPAPDLSLGASGNILVSLENETTQPVTGYLRYAIYGQTKDNNVTRHAHILLADTSSPGWQFEYEGSQRRNAIYIKRTEANGIYWSEQLLYVDEKQDWPAAYWQENACNTPPVWLAKRYSTTSSDRTKLVLEYREPLPAGVSVHTEQEKYKTVMKIDAPSQEAQKALAAFEERSAQAFTLLQPQEATLAVNADTGAELTGASAPAQMLAKKPSIKPNMTKLVGKIAVRSLIFDEI